jgi:hypothetical protein
MDLQGVARLLRLCCSQRGWPDILVSALRHGLPGRDSLPQLLARERGVLNPRGKPLLTEDTILDWAKVHHERTGKWPRTTSGVIKGLDEYWQRIDIALRAGTRGLPGGDSLRLLLLRRFGVRTVLGDDRLTEERILEWADAHYAATGRWPTSGSREVIPATGTTWISIHHALQRGLHGLPGGDSLTGLLARHGRPVKLQKRHLWFPGKARRALAEHTRFFAP